MKFFIDTANLNEIREAYELGVLDGVTTNPSLMAKEGISGKNNVFSHYKAICDIVDGDVSAEVIATDFAGMIREGEELAEIDEKIVVKIPMIKDGVKALKYFSEKGIKTNCTLIFSAGQALLAAKAGAASAPSASARSSSRTSNARSRKVGIRSSGMTRSKEPIGTIARLPPLVVVVSASLAPRRQAPSTTPQTENLSTPGAIQPNSSRSPASARAETCR